MYLYESMWGRDKTQVNNNTQRYSNFKTKPIRKFISKRFLFVLFYISCWIYQNIDNCFSTFYSILLQPSRSIAILPISILIFIPSGIPISIVQARKTKVDSCVWAKHTQSLLHYLRTSSPSFSYPYSHYTRYKSCSFSTTVIVNRLLSRAAFQFQGKIPFLYHNNKERPNNQNLSFPNRKKNNACGDTSTNFYLITRSTSNKKYSPLIMKRRHSKNNNNDEESNLPEPLTSKKRAKVVSKQAAKLAQEQEDDLQKKTVLELKEMLSDINQPISGRKSELIARYIASTKSPVKTSETSNREKMKTTKKEEDNTTKPSAKKTTSPAKTKEKSTTQTTAASTMAALLNRFPNRETFQRASTPMKEYVGDNNAKLGMHLLSANEGSKALLSSQGLGSIRVISWNVAGLRGLLNKEGGISCLQTFVSKYNPHIFFMQEHKLQEIHVADIETTLRDILPHYHSYWSCSTGKKGYSGVVTLVHDSIKEDVISIQDSSTFLENEDDARNEGRVLALELNQAIFVNSYVPNSGEKLQRLQYRTQQWDESLANFLKNLERSKGKPVILGGDLNVAYDDIDFFNPQEKRMEKAAGTTPEERASFKAWSTRIEFVDSFRYLHPDAMHVYTYWSMRAGNRPFNRGLRLDYLLKGLFPALMDQYVYT